MGGYLFFNLYWRLGKKYYDQQNFYQEKHFSSVPTPAINNERLLIKIKYSFDTDLSKVLSPDI
jgi:hypothetical protein